MTLEAPEEKTPRTVRTMWKVFAAIDVLILLYTAYASGPAGRKTKISPPNKKPHNPPLNTKTPRKTSKP